MRPKKGMTAKKIVRLVHEQIAEADRLCKEYARAGNEISMRHYGDKRHHLSMLLWQIAEQKNGKS